MMELDMTTNAILIILCIVGILLVSLGETIMFIEMIERIKSKHEGGDAE